MDCLHVIKIDFKLLKIAFTIVRFMENRLAEISYPYFICDFKWSIKFKFTYTNNPKQSRNKVFVSLLAFYVQMGRRNKIEENYKNKLNFKHAKKWTINRENFETPMVKGQ